MLLPFSSSSNPLLGKLRNKEISYLGGEPTSVLDTITSPSPPTSTSTFSGGGGSNTAAVAAVSGNPSQKWQQETTSSSNVGVDSSGCEVPPPPPEIGSAAAGGAEKCGLPMEDWENQEQEQSILRWIMGDVEDPSMGLNKLLQSGQTPSELDFNGGFGVADQGLGFGLDPVDNLIHTMNPSLPSSGFHHPPNKFNTDKVNLPPNPNPNLSPLSNNLVLSPPQIFNPQMLINHHQTHPTQTPPFFLPPPFTPQEQHLFMPPSKRHNHGGVEPPLLPQHQLQLLSQFQNQRPTMGMKPKMVGEETGQQQAIIDQLYKVAELIQTGNSVLAQGILARLNHQLSSPIGKPFYRAAFFCKEALQLLTDPNMVVSPNSTPFNLILKIGAYKSFSEISPLLQFAHFTCNQAILEALEGFGRIHIVDFDINFGGQWASLMQELALRSGGPPSLKITAFASPLTHDQLELGLTRDNLIHFSGEINMPLEFEILNLDILNSASWSLPFQCSENEAIAVNLPIGSFATYQLPLPLIIRFVKQISPKIVVSIDRGSDRTDLPFPNHVIHALQSFSNLLESLDAVNVNLDALQKIERFLIQPGIEKIVTGRYRSPDKTPHWRTLFLSSGLSPLTFSNFTESQADCLVKRTPIRGFHIEKRQSSLVLCWQRKELISASAWRC